jgi:hypothetical protein
LIERPGLVATLDGRFLIRKGFLYDFEHLVSGFKL